MKTKLVLRLSAALIFATIAAIFALLVSPVLGADSDIVRILLTVLAALVGFLIFPKLAERTVAITLSLFNAIIHRVSQEVSTQILRLRAHQAQTTPQVSTSSITLVKPVILDTSAIIDGRILDVARAGFLSGLVLIPRFILTELQQVADSSDELKRARGRKGFETVEELKKIKSIRVEVWDKEQSGRAVDDKLINLAKGLGAKIVTTDYNLNKVASIANLGVLNVNELANAVKANVLPGESYEIKIMHPGKDESQGVGYLEDGTMVVVKGGASAVNNKILVKVTKNIQTPAGKMIFAEKI